MSFGGGVFSFIIPAFAGHDGRKGSF